MDASKVAVAFAEELDKKFDEYAFSVQPGRRFDRIVQVHAHAGFGGAGHVHAFVDRNTGDLIKAATWKAPQKNPTTGKLAIRFNLSQPEGMREALESADKHGHYLYAR